MLVKSITEEEIYGIGHAFGYYDYGEEIGMLPFPGKRPLQTIFALMCAGYCGTVFYIPPASGARAISPIEKP